ncbi:hypothetical protein XFUD_06985 [Xylella fastidiosa]|uniref:YqaJ viral recombinase domain-containing protein n=1 Tax=Xylella fastidiosa (strain 9a5c) TaxID=160492 RepID=Q9PCV8_XYLFA|nr:YqaJ viral recombinase family protein [Xylella fastidiosa]AAF84456.1 hypothetical protein XF_1647 [Xylella fastidiosa 9a5c]ALQ94944.1 hypothetical protein XFUD_06985 [Xylella fastidiosa]
MKIIELTQGTPQWHTHRAQHLNASDAPAMMGCSPYKSRAELIRERATGITPDYDQATLQRFAEGHRAEELARPLAERIIGDDLYPCVGVDGMYSASFDGLTLLEDTVWEHKQLNDTIRAAMTDGSTGQDLPFHYQLQMEHQSMVSGAQRVLFMASAWNGEQLIEERHCWYTPTPELRNRIINGWHQLQADIAAYQPEPPPPPAALGRSPEQLPALHIAVTGTVTTSNLPHFKACALAVLHSIKRDLHTDEDFANAEQTVKWCKGVETRLDATKQQVLGQTADIDAVFRTLDEIAEETRRVRLELDRLVNTEKAHRRTEIVHSGLNTLRDYYASSNATLGEYALPIPADLPAKIGDTIKGKKSMISMQEAVSTAVAHEKSNITAHVERVRTNITVLEECGTAYLSLFPDRVSLCISKTPDDLRNLILARIAHHQQQEQARIQAERERQNTVEATPLPTSPTVNCSTESSVTTAPTPASIHTTLKLGEINALIAPLSINADGLAALGFVPVNTERATKWYAAAEFPVICHTLKQVLSDAASRTAIQQAA